MSTPIAARLGEFVAGLSWADLPADVVAHIKRCILDTVGCALYGSTTPWVRILRETATAATTGAGSATVWGGGERLDPPDAALVNGTAAHSFELDDLHPRSILHPGAVVVPAALAAAAMKGGPVSGADLLRAIIAGYEVGARAGSALGGAHLLAGWHPTGTHGTLASAAAASAILGADARATAHALGVAGSHAAGLMASQYGAMVKRLHAGHAARSGLFAAALAERGFTGIDTLFESDYGGYLSTFAPAARPELITSELGERWEVLQVGFKRYAACGSNHTTIDALLELREQARLVPEEITSVEVAASTATYKHVGWAYRPDSVTAAQMNLPYAVAVALVDGDAFVEQYTPERIADERLRRLAGRVTVRPDPEIDDRGDAGRHNVSVTVHRQRGAPLHTTRLAPTGSARCPLRAEDVTAKYHRLADQVLGAERSHEVRRTVDTLEDTADVGALSRLLGMAALPHTAPPEPTPRGA